MVNSLQVELRDLNYLNELYAHKWSRAVKLLFNNR